MSVQTCLAAAAGSVTPSMRGFLRSVKREFQAVLPDPTSFSSAQDCPPPGWRKANYRNAWLSCSLRSALQWHYFLLDRSKDRSPGFIEHFDAHLIAVLHKRSFRGAVLDHFKASLF